MAKVCVLIGEGKSEKAFFSSLLLNQLHFEEVTEKNCIVYKSKKDSDLFWIFPIPSYGVSHKGGYKMLQKTHTYIDCKTIVHNHKYFFGDNPDIHYRILTDTDNNNKENVKQRKAIIKKAFLGAKTQHKDYKIFPANIEIESWFIAGLTNNFPFIGDINAAKKIIQSTNAETYINPKETLDLILEKRLSGNRQIIGRDFGEHINIKQALLKSNSFSDFFYSLLDDELLIFKLPN